MFTQKIPPVWALTWAAKLNSDSLLQLSFCSELRSRNKWLLWKPRPCYTKIHWILEKKKSPLTKSQIHSHIPNLLAKGITDFFLPIPSFCLWRGVEESAFVVVLVCKLLTKLNNSPPNWPTKYLACLLMTSLRWHKTKAIISSLESLDCYFWTIIWFGVFILIWRQLRIFCDSVEHLEELILLLHVFK